MSYIPNAEIVSELREYFVKTILIVSYDYFPTAWSKHEVTY